MENNQNKRYLIQWNPGKSKKSYRITYLFLKGGNFAVFAINH